jgi:7-carboxy-7-deazaguanine synthase
MLVKFGKIMKMVQEWKGNKMRLLEISQSIHGELPFQGQACTIIRLAGCNLSCSYCDVKASTSYELSIEEVYKRIEENGYHHILLTGGEPLLQSGEIMMLSNLLGRGHRYHIMTIETNGTVEIDEWPMERIVMDYKNPEMLTADQERQTINNLSRLKLGDLVKFIFDESFTISKISKLVRTFARIYPVITWVFSPKVVDKEVISFEKDFPEFLALSKEFPGKIFLQLQIHKFLNLP